MIAQDPLLEVRELRTYFHTDEGIGRAVDGVAHGNTVCLDLHDSIPQFSNRV